MIIIYTILLAGQVKILRAELILKSRVKMAG